MRLVRATEFTHAVAVDRRGHRSLADMLSRDERDRYLIEAARLHCAGMSDRAAAAMLHMKLSRYREGGWRRERSEALCPPRLAGRVEASCWRILRCRDAVPSARSIRLTLARRR